MGCSGKAPFGTCADLRLCNKKLSCSNSVRMQAESGQEMEKLFFFSNEANFNLVDTQKAQTFPTARRTNFVRVVCIWDAW